MNETLFICKECKESTKRVIRGQCEKCYAESKDSKKQLETALDHVDNCIETLGSSLNLADPDGTISHNGYKSPVEEKVWKAVFDDFRKLSDAIKALRKDN